MEGGTGYEAGERAGNEGAGRRFSPQPFMFPFTAFENNCSVTQVKNREKFVIVPRKTLLAVAQH